jgi:soluble cytochrome b562
MNVDGLEKSLSQTEARITDCGGRAALADDRARELDAKAKQYRRAESLFEQWYQASAGINVDIRQYITGGQWHRLELEDEEQATDFTKAQNLYIDQLDKLASQAHRERMNAENARDEQANLKRVRNEYQQDLRKVAGTWD